MCSPSLHFASFPLLNPTFHPPPSPSGQFYRDVDKCVSCEEDSANNAWIYLVVLAAIALGAWPASKFIKWTKKEFGSYFGGGESGEESSASTLLLKDNLMSVGVTWQVARAVG